jgi:hypothetical protein
MGSIKVHALNNNNELHPSDLTRYNELLSEIKNRPVGPTTDAEVQQDVDEQKYNKDVEIVDQDSDITDDEWLQEEEVTQDDLDKLKDRYC